ncbi:hypothetical protein V8C26DRAFT_416158 [Trichoderma gracile]
MGCAARNVSVTLVAGTTNQFLSYLGYGIRMPPINRKTKASRLDSTSADCLCEVPCGYYLSSPFTTMKAHTTIWSCFCCVLYWGHCFVACMRRLLANQRNTTG